jgi:exopolysaccharide production protein ExoQ
MAPAIPTHVMVSIALLLWWLAQQLQPLFANPEVDPTPATTATAEGSLFNTLVVIAFAAIGGLCLPHALGAFRTRALVVFLTLLGLYFVWSALSLMWSVDPSLTVRRYVQLVFIVAGCVGLGLGVYGASTSGLDLLARHVMWAGLIGIAIMWLLVFRSGDLDVLDPAWAGKEEGIGTRIGYPIAFAVLAAIYLRGRGSLGPGAFALVLVVAVVSLLAQKARFTIAFGFLAALLLIVRRARWGWGWTLALAALGIAAWLLALAYAIGGTSALQPILDGVYNYATLGTGGADTETLTGRFPLWDELWRYAERAPWLGYGFGAFWNPTFLLQIWAVIDWHPPVGHNGFLDEVLGTGVIGLILLLSAWLFGGVVAWRRRDWFGAFVSSAMLLFLLLNVGDTIMQYYFQFPFYAALTALFALLARSTAEPRVS